MTINKDQLIEILSTAEEQVSFLGVVAIDADWDFLAEQWSSKLRDNLNFRINVLCESDNMLFSKAFTCDTDLASERRSFEDLKFVRDRVFDLEELLLSAGAPEDVFDIEKPRVYIEIIHLQIPVSVVKVDGKIFISLWLHEVWSEFEEVEKDNPWMNQFDSYIRTYFNQDLGRKYSCKYGEENLELFDHHRVPRGIYPRESFYDTDYSQLVVWAFIFDRKGRLLIHRRSENAKDNQEMWDKSVGGHVDFEKDINTSRAVLREVIEELFGDEMKKSKVDFTPWWAVSDAEMVYLGEWRPGQRRRHPFNEINSFRHEWTYFRLPYSQRISSPRTLPDGRVRRLRVIADAFLFITSPALNDECIEALENSMFKLIELSELKNAMDKALRKEEVPGFDEKFVFKWEDVPGNDSKKLLNYLKDDHGIRWAEQAKIKKSGDGKTISIFKNEYSTEIKIDESGEKATLKISDSKIYNLKIKKKNGKLNIHDEQNLVPKFTPDLMNIMTGTVRDTLEEFSQYIKKYIKSER